MKSNISYRPEIDGLRCLAVLSVIFYHYEFSFSDSTFLTGGYIGVDIFYVISGYLITSIILKDIKKKEFSLLFFYQRRVRRLIPALFFVILFFIPISWMLLLPSELKDFFSSISFSTFFVSNIFFWKIGEIYGAAPSVLMPLLHTWSLAIEEQFYIFYPFLILFIISIFKNKNLNVIIFFIFILSLGFAQYISIKHPTFNFYMLPSRIWELLAGAIISINEKSLFNNRFRSYSSSLSLIGIILIIISILFFNKNILHPSLITLVPVIGTMFLIIYTKNNNFIKKILISTPFVNVGLISYSLYLWHYPLYSFFVRLPFLDTESNINKFILVIVTVLLSILTYYYVEKPFRNQKINTKKIILFLCSIIILLNLSVYFVLKNNGYEKRLRLSNTQKNFIYPKNSQNNKEQIHKNNLNLKNITIIGNSHAKDFFDILKLNENIVDKHNINLLNIQIKCLKTAIKSNLNNCLKKFDFKSQKKFKDQIKSIEKSEIIIFKTRWSNDDIKSLKDIKNMKEFKNKKIIIINAAPEFLFKKKTTSVYKNILKQRMHNILSPLDQFVIKEDRVPNGNERQKLENYYFSSLNFSKITQTNFLLEKLSRQLKIQHYNFFEKLCMIKDEKCEIIRNGNKLYLDDNGHLSIEGKIFFSKKIENLIK